MSDSFFRNKTVLITGHTGFKGAWMCKIFLLLGAKVVGYSLAPPTKPSLFETAQIKNHIISIIGDVRDIDSLYKVVNCYRPEFVFHMAAQPIVRDGYKNPVYTYETNVMGTVNILEVIRKSGFVRSFINITTDKVYENKEWMWGYRENDYLDGYDPYSNSKSCSELITSSYRRSFSGLPAISTCRAGNVIGGGDFAPDRIIPDCIRAAHEGKRIKVRNPYSVRPYQHVIEAIFAYLLVAQKQYAETSNYQGAYNIGPNSDSCVTTARLVGFFCKSWGENVQWDNISQEKEPHEAGMLELDCTKIKNLLAWAPKWNIEKAVDETVKWSRAFYNYEDVDAIMVQQISEYLEGEKL